MLYKILPTSSVRMLRLLSQPNRHNKNDKLTPGWLGTFYYFSENVIGYTSAGVDRKIPNISNFTTKYAIWFSKKSRLSKIAFPSTSPNDWAQSILEAFGQSWINNGNLLQIGPSLSYLMALPFSETMIKSTRLIISFPLNLPCRMSTYRFLHSLLKRMHASPQHTSNR